MTNAIIQSLNAILKYHEEKNYRPEVRLQTCTECKQEKSTELFSDDLRHKDGKQSRCKACMTTYSKMYKRGFRRRKGEWVKVTLGRKLKKPKLKMGGIGRIR